MEKRTVFALVLIIIIFYISSEFIWKPKQEVKLEQTQQPETTQQQVPAPQQQTPSEAQKTDLESPQSLVQEESIPVTENIVLENDAAKITFSNAGASIIKAELKNFLGKDKVDNVNLIRDDGAGLQTVMTDQSGNKINLEDYVFSYTTFPNSIEFLLQIQEIIVKKTYRLVDSYHLEYSYEVQNYESLSGYKIGFSDGIADTEAYLKDKKNDYRIYSQVDNQIENEALRKLKEPKVIEGKVDWMAVRSKYFLLALIPGDLVIAEKSTLFTITDQESPAFEINVEISQPSFRHDYQIYMGPLQESELEVYGIGLDNTIQMGPGFLRWLSKLFRSFFILLYSLIPQWGVCIIIFSFLMKLVLYPLTHKSFESSMKMQEVQPKMKAVQDKYKHDPRLMNKEVQKLYKEHGVNPMSGCLPMLPQLPIFIALMPIFRNAIELRQAEFLWMSDLSEPDPYLILPIIMAVFMFIQQILMRPKKQNEEEMDDKQKAAMQSQKMMGYIMPIVMFFLFKSFPAGLVIYWTSFNIFSLFQQYYIRKKFSPTIAENK